MLALKSLIEEHGPLAGRVKRVRVESYSDAVRLGAGVPDALEQAQFSISWLIAVILLDCEVHPRAVLPGRLADQAVRDLASRVCIVENPELTRLFLLSEAGDPAGKEAAILHAKLRDETALSSGLVANVLFPQPPMEGQTVEDKFGWVTADVLTACTAEQIIRTCRDLAALSDVRELVNILINGRSLL